MGEKAIRNSNKRKSVSTTGVLIVFGIKVWWDNSWSNNQSPGIGSKWSTRTPWRDDRSTNGTNRASHDIITRINSTTTHKNSALSELLG